MRSYLGLTWFGPLRDAHKDITWQTPLRRLAVWRYAASFYPARLHRTEELDPDANYIFAAQPHGIFCSAMFLAFATEGLGFSKLFPGAGVGRHVAALCCHAAQQFDCRSGLL